MTLAAGTKLGPYEILGPLGAGGMGEVYQARDERLKRDVAIKVLPASYSQDADRLRRFEHEAQAAGALNHPNITAVYDLGTHDRAPYIVTELLEGETLRARIAGGALAVRKAIDYAVQIARGLAAAHEKGIIHRDLKPENLFLTKDGRVKILDFGLAKLTQSEGAGGPQTNLPTATAGTEAGVVMGTLGYMSPEQVKGQPTDQRSDLFSLGTILYEMLSGSRAFHRDSAAETISAILREEPPDLSATNRNVQPGLERIVRHCLEKNPEERFYSARDLAFDLEALSGVSGTVEVPAKDADFRARPSWRLLAGTTLAGVLVAVAMAYFAGRRGADRPPPSFHQLTFRRGIIWNARFGSDGKTVLYSAAWDGGATEIHLGRSDGQDSRPFGLKGADVLAVASSGDIAVALGTRFSGSFTRIGTLARTAATGGGAPREILENVEFAAWTPDGRDIAVVHVVSGRRRLEYPPGKVLYETTGWIGEPRFSPRGDRIAFLDHPVFGDDGGAVALLDLAGKKSTITPVFATAAGLAWSPGGSEIWFTAAEVGGNRALQAVTPSGRLRVLFRGTGRLTLQDVSGDGRVLMTHDLVRVGLVALGMGGPKERDLSWFDWSLLADLSENGRDVLFSESGEGGGPGYSVFIRSTDGSPAVRLGEGQALSLSPDGKRVLAVLHPTADQQLVIHPTGPGEPKAFSLPNLRVQAAVWLPDSRRFLMTAAEPGHDSRVYLGDAEGGDPKPLTPEKYRGPRGVNPVDARHFLARGPEGMVYVCPIDGGEPVPVPAIGAEDVIVGPSIKEGTVYVRRGRGLPLRIVRLDLGTGREEEWRELMPADPTGIVDLFGTRVTRDGRYYGYSYGRLLSDLYMVEGLK
ncbi:MAG TPA: protein kinase [Thermoanaerobaculia bacterium]|nr:protein kinase [Thermoanaerobaculia bacterium]